MERGGKPNSICMQDSTDRICLDETENKSRTFLLSLTPFLAGSTGKKSLLMNTID